jgi:hypothetical protein
MRLPTNIWVRLKLGTPKSTCQSWISISYIPDAVIYAMGYHWFWTIPTWPEDICVKWSLPLIDIGSWKLPQPQNPTDFTEGTSNIGFVYNLYIPIHYEQTPNNILLLILATLTYYTYIYSTYSLPHQAVDEMTSVSHLPPSLHIFATCMVVIMSSQCYLPFIDHMDHYWQIIISMFTLG